MGFTTRLLLAVIIFAADFVLFFVPLSAFFLAYILVFNPPWFRELLNQAAVDGS